MIGIVDLATVVILKDGFEFLAKNPNHLEFALNMYCRYAGLQKLVGTKHLKDSIDYVVNNRIEINTFYELDIKRRPSISIISSGTENMQFIGDTGGSQTLKTVLNPVIYETFDVKKISDDEIHVAAGLKLDQKLWTNVHIGNGAFQTKLVGMNPLPDKTVLFLKDSVPSGTSLKGWQAMSSPGKKGYNIGASTDDVTIQLKLSTNGSFSVHRLLAVILRYCLKKNRLRFDEFGIQVATFGYTPPMPTEAASNDETEYESVFTISGKFTDRWIDSEFDVIDDAARIDLDLEATSNLEGREDVKLE